MRFNLNCTGLLLGFLLSCATVNAIAADTVAKEEMTPPPAADALPVDKIQPANTTNALVTPPPAQPTTAMPTTTLPATVVPTSAPPQMPTATLPNQPMQATAPQAAQPGPPTQAIQPVPTNSTGPTPQPMMANPMTQGTSVLQGAPAPQGSPTK